MKLRTCTSIAALALAGFAAPAFADSYPGEYNGPYIAVSGGLATHDNHGGNRDTVVFDTNRDGSYDNGVLTSTGGNAFANGFCNGAATAPTDPGTGTVCTPDHDAADYAVRLGYDARFGNLVAGVLVEGSKNDATDSTTAFSTTPASYTFTRGLDYAISARARLGFAPGNRGLMYVTGGPSYAKLNHTFTTTNTVNSFTQVNPDKMVWGWQAGGGAEVVLGGGVTLGMEYLYNRYRDRDYYVQVGPGTAGATNPFVLSGGAGGVYAVQQDPNYDFHTFRAVLGFRF
ncbi:MAG: outer membrane protein [Novosphingobium sp.]